jgi:hypothetical protein
MGVHRRRRPGISGDDHHDRHDGHNRNHRDDRNHDDHVGNRYDKHNELGRDRVGGPPQPPRSARPSLPSERMSGWGRGAAPSRSSSNLLRTPDGRA